MTRRGWVARTRALFEPTEQKDRVRPDAAKHMAKINGNEITPGKMVEYDGGLWMAVKSVKVKPGKGGAYNQVELKNVLDGRKLNQRFLQPVLIA